MVSKVQVRSRLASPCYFASKTFEASEDSESITTRGHLHPGNPLLSPRVGEAASRAQKLGISHWLWVTFASWWPVLWHREALSRVTKFYFGWVKKCDTCIKDVVSDSLDAGASLPGFRLPLPVYSSQFPHLSHRIITGTTT